MVAPTRPLLVPAAAYAATVAHVVDGATITCDVDLGMARLGANLWLHDVRVCLAGAAARPLHAPGGMEARNHLAGLLPVGQPIVLRPLAMEATRVTGRIAVFGTDITDQLVATGWAAPYHGRGPKPTPPWPRATEEQ